MPSSKTQASTQLTWVPGLDKQRKKRFSSKVKTGCETCKKRRIKCDEGKPTCVNCNRSGKRCEGYQSAAPHFYWHEHDGTGRKSDGVTSLSPSVNSKYGTDGDKALLDLFLNKTAVELVKFSNPYFWYTLVPQASWSHEGIRQAVAAVGLACSESEHPQDQTVSRPTQSFYHYNAAIRSLTTTGEATPPETMLICCVLFWLFENLKYRPCIAMTHLKAAVKMLNERPRLASHREDLTSTYIEPLLQEGMVFAATILPTGGRKRHDAPATLSAFESAIARLQPSESPKDLHGCRYDFGRCQEALVTAKQMQMSASSPDPDMSMIRDLYTKWKVALERNAHRFPIEYVRMLRMHYASQMLMVDMVEFHVNGMDIREGPSWRPRLRWVLDEARYFVSLKQEQAKDCTRESKINLSLITLLTTLARQCITRDEDYAEEAISLLENNEWFEGIWNSRVAGQVLKFLRVTDTGHKYCRTGDLEAVLERAAAIKEHVPTKRKKNHDVPDVLQFDSMVQEIIF